jgi:indolepyruvate ferredoxin oxidoreductase beta subunit
VAGLGGQGILLVSKVLTEAAARTYPFVCRTESRGLAQRGGSVHASVRFGHESVSPVIGLGDADFVLALDVLEAVRARSYLKPGAYLLANSRLTPPLHLMRQWQGRGSAIEEWTDVQDKLHSVLAAYANHITLDLKKLAADAGCSKALNVVLLGAASHYLPVPRQDLREAMKTVVKAKYQEANERAFDLGREAVAAPAQIYAKPISA